VVQAVDEAAIQILNSDANSDALNFVHNGILLDRPFPQAPLAMTVCSAAFDSR
jgi:hypothetical protein